MFMRTLCVIGLLTLTCFGCGTDVKPSTISSVFSSEAVMDDVSNCLVSTPIIDENNNTVTITADNDCLISVVKRLEDPVSISDIVKSPPKYIGKEVTFTAEVERYLEGYFDDRGRYLPYVIQLDTPDPDVIFDVTYYDTQYPGGIPLVGEAYEFTVIINYVFHTKIMKMCLLVLLTALWLRFHNSNLLTNPVLNLTPLTRRMSFWTQTEFNMGEGS